MTQGGRRQTKAERKEEARRRRLEEMKRRQRQARLRKIWFGAIAAVAIAAIVVGVMLAGKGSKEAKQNLDKLAAAAGCTEIQEPDDQGQGHTTTPTEVVQYNTSPPTNGKHAGRWEATGVQTAPIQNEVQVHNLEHGHVIVSYKPDVDQAFIDKLEELAKADNTRIVVAPYNTMEAKLAVTSWARISTCNEVKDSFLDFARAYIDFYKGKGPEGDIPGTPRGA